MRDTRLGDEERASLVAALRRHVSEGRLTLEEFEERVGLVFAASRRSDADEAFADLPQPRPARRDGRARPALAAHGRGLPRPDDGQGDARVARPARRVSSLRRELASWRMYPGEHARQHPDQPAYIMASTGEVTTFAEYEARANRLAHLFRDIGLQRGDHVAEFMENHPRYLEVQAAAERTGLYYTCINSYLSVDEVAYIVNDSGTRVLVVSAGKRVLTWCEERGQLEKQEPYRHSIGLCERCHSQVEPLVMLQWWVEMTDLVQPAIEALRASTRSTSATCRFFTRTPSRRR